MKYVITKNNGVFAAPVTLVDWTEANQDEPALIGDAYHEWLYGRPFITGGRTSPQITNYLIELP